MRVSIVSVLALASCLCLCSELIGEKPVGYGDKDFYPSAERPVGYRGDGNGWFPGARPVAVFWEGTPAEKTVQRPNKWGKMQDVKYIARTDDTPKNIVWKTRLPAWANSQPIVVGDKVLTLGEPDWLICLDARSGKVLWAKRCNVWSAMGLQNDLAQRIHEMFRIYRALDAVLDGQFTDRQPRLGAAEFRTVRQILAEKCLPGMLARLGQLDPETDYAAASKDILEAIDLFLADEKKYDKAKGKLKGKGPMRKLLAERIEALGGQQIDLDMPWGNMVGWAMSVPVSDGKHVYASFGQGQTACFDLNGHLIWQRFIQAPKGRTDTIQSPLLAGNVLVDMHGGGEVLRGLDKATGQTVWTAPTKGDYEFGKKGGYYVGSHKIVRLAEQGQDEDVIVTSLCNIIRARDGKVLGVLPFDGGASGGPSIFSSGNRVYKSSCGDNYGTPLYAYRLELAGDAVKVQPLWTLGRGKKGCPGYHGQVATDEMLILTSSAGNIVSAEDGEVILKGRRKGGLGELSNILAGNTMIWCQQGHRDQMMTYWGKRRPDGEVSLQFFAADVSDPANPKRLDRMNVLGGENIPHDPALEEFVKPLYDAGLLWGSWNGLPAHFMHVDTGVFPQGNRLFIRSVSHMYCVGDPAQAWHTPAGAPAQARTQTD